jgi:hypothetical protein
VTIAKKKSVIDEIFGGTFKQEFKIGGSKVIRASLEPFFIINLEIKKDLYLEECLDLYFSDKTVEGNYLLTKLFRL